MPCPASKCSIGLWGHFRWALLLNKQPLTANPAETTEAAMPLSPAPFPRVTRLSSPRTRERRDCGLSPVWTCAVTYCFYKESLSLKIPQEPIISGDRTRVRLAKTSWANARYQLQIWDGQSGRIVWEGISDLTLAQEVIREQPVRFEDIIQETWASLIEQIPADSAFPARTE